jgi:hypothetical protein
VTRAKAKEVLDGAGYVSEVRHENGGVTFSFNPELREVHERLAAAERNIILLTALLRAVSPARFGLSQTLEQMCKEAGIS